MSNPTRRDLLRDVGTGMFVASLGPAVAADLGLGLAHAADAPDRLTFGDLDPLVGFIQDTPADRLLPLALEKLRTGTDLKRLVAAAALANARAFGGEDYVGFHTLMALVPAFHMAAEMPADRRPLPVLKVLVRNATRLTETGGKPDALQPVTPAASGATAERLRDAVRRGDRQAAERTFAALTRDPLANTLDDLMLVVDDATEVHRTVLVSRSWDLIDFVGRERAGHLLRQSVRFCLSAEKNPNYVKHYQEVRTLLPKLLDAHKLADKPLGHRSVEDAWVERFGDTLFRGTPAQAAEAAAAALADGIDPAAVGEAVSLTANQLVLRDEGRPKSQASPGKPVGSCHGDSIGVHACDSVNAWRNIARHGGPRTAASSLILAAYQVASDRTNRGGDFHGWKPYPRPEHIDQVREVGTTSLLPGLDRSIRDKDQGRAAALTSLIVHERTNPTEEVFALLRRYAVSEDGALHAEKFYRTTVEEYTAARPAFKNRYIVALARVTASSFGTPAPGYAEACRLLKV
ncbi:MAG: hypothetical protein U0871_03920 [Gemmataceae bacterium]